MKAFHQMLIFSFPLRKSDEDSDICCVHLQTRTLCAFVYVKLLKGVLGSIKTAASLWKLQSATV